MKRLRIYKRFIKRPQDFVCASVATVVLSPVMLATAVLVRKNLGTPVLFAQERPGKNGRVFKLYKFRTMTDERDENGELLPDEARLTRFGRMLRGTSLDELPELLNIIRGDMAVVGPRPLLVKYLPRYNAHQARRHEVRPGFTGLVQVHGRNAISWEEKFDWDVKYPSTDFSVSYTDNVNAGTAFVTVNGTGDYSGTIEKSFTIEAASLKEVALSQTSYEFDGEAKMPTVTVTDDREQVLEESKDYTVNYYDNTDVGTATVEVIGQNNYQGTLTANFIIEEKPQEEVIVEKQPVSVRASAKTVKAKKLKKKAITVAPISVSMTDGIVTYKIVAGNKKSKKALKLNVKTGQITVKKKTKKGTYKLRVNVTATGTEEYKSASKTVNVKVIIK